MTSLNTAAPIKIEFACADHTEAAVILAQVANAQRLLADARAEGRAEREAAEAATAEIVNATDPAVAAFEALKAFQGYDMQSETDLRKHDELVAALRSTEATTLAGAIAVAEGLLLVGAGDVDSDELLGIVLAKLRRLAQH